MTKLRLTLRSRRRDSGQALVLIAISFIAIAAFIGLAVDLGILIVQQAHLRRAVDAASLAAATQIREGASVVKVEEFAKQFIDMNGLEKTTVTIETCSNTPSMCTNPPRKLIRVRAQMPVRFSFLPIIGLRETILVADATAEAAAVDLVLVIGTNETMGEGTPGTACPFKYLGCQNFDPNASPAGGETGCNNNRMINPNNGTTPQKCRPLWDAKQAAKVVLDRLYDDADRVAIVTYDYAGRVIYPLTVITDGHVNAVDGVSPATGAYAALDDLTVFNAASNPIGAPPADRQSPNTKLGKLGLFSPLNASCVYTSPGSSACSGNSSPSGTAVNSLCVGCGIRQAGELLKNSGRPEAVWIIIFLSDGFATLSDTSQTYTGDPALISPNGFCQGGLSATSLPWKIPGVNQGDPTVDNVYAWGLWNPPFCRNGGFGDGIGDVTYNVPGFGSYTQPKSVTPNPFVRMCGPYHPSAAACPPGAYYVGAAGAVTVTVPTTRTIIADGVFSSTSILGVTRNQANQTALFYSAEDYARDMIDFAALTVRCSAPDCDPLTGISASGIYNPNETHGSFGRLVGANVSIYAIGIGSRIVAQPDYSGARLLRYMAAVGDDGDRVTDRCLLSPGIPAPFDARNCGDDSNYFYAQNPSDLLPIFQEISKKIFTRIAR